MVCVLAALVPLPAQATDLSQGQNTVNNIRQADPPSVSTGTKASPVGQPISDYKPKPKTLSTSEPPPPSIKSYNPKNDPDVQKGWDDHQTQYGHDDDDE